MLVGLNNVKFEFGSRVIVDEATWHIQPGERIGLIGYNGQGKSTLLKVLTGQYTPSVGTLEKGKNVSIGYLHQDLLSFSTDDSIVEVAMQAFERVKQLEKEIEELGLALEKTSDEKLLEDYTDKLHEMDVLDGYNIQYKTEEVLQGLGFTPEQVTQPYKTFSGGWRMRVLLAKMILQSPDVLLLDEPTNHLDLPSIEWLEKYLSKYKGSVVIVSHDKFFLNKLVTKIVELYQQRLHFYTGNYDYYETEREIRMDQMQRAYENQQDYIRQQERFIERFRSKASKAAAAQSAIKRLDKMDKIEQVSLERPNLNINFQVDRQPGKIIITLKDISKYFGENTILQDANVEINRGDKIGLIGANGKGKSTLLRIIAGTESFEGERNWGHNVEESFYAQHQLESLHLENSVLAEMATCSSGKTDQEYRNILGCFLFGGEDVDKKIKILSGGEKARVALAKVIASKSNFLLLDEPTNHLDMVSVELLADALNKYQGTLITVSHDRFFISKVANKIWEIVDGEIKVFDGTYAEYISWKEHLEKKAREAAKNNNSKSEEKLTPAPVKKVEAPKAQLNRDQQKDLERAKSKFSKLERLIAELKSQQKQIETDMADPATYASATKFEELEKAHLGNVDKLKDAEAEYETLFEKIMEMEA